jgi:hypothetical protein
MVDTESRLLLEFWVCADAVVPETMCIAEGAAIGAARNVMFGGISLHTWLPD